MRSIISDSHAFQIIRRFFRWPKSLIPTMPSISLPPNGFAKPGRKLIINGRVIHLG